MCELLIRVVNKAGGTSANTERGDVVTVAPDGWVWSCEECGDPHWRILRLPGVAVESAAGLLLPEGDVTPQERRQNPLLRVRKYRLDIDNPGLPGELADFLADDARAAAMFTVDGEITLASLTLEKPALEG